MHIDFSSYETIEEENEKFIEWKKKERKEIILTRVFSSKENESNKLVLFPW